MTWREPRRRRAALLGLLGVFAGSFALAQGGAGKGAVDGRRSGYQEMGAALQQMQDDDTANPAMLFVQLGRQLWSRPMGAAGKACADCHEVPGMRGVATRYPAMADDAAGGGRPVDLEGRIALCHTQHQEGEPWPAENRDLLALSAFVALQSRGQPIAPPADPRLTPARAHGEALYRARQGQLNLSCASCHDENAGRKLAGITIPQAHPTGYPIYRLEWQGLGSLRRRLRNCLIGMRAEPFAYEAPDYVALEIYLMDRAKGMVFEAPGVRP
ncbi:MAG: sulfur oxidation c-type cytochrome SoxA [Pseudomonadota bacterium]